MLNGFGKPEEIEAARAGVAEDFGVPVAYSAADMSKPGSIAEMIEMTLDMFGRLDVLVNNAGIQHVAPLQEFPPAKWDAILAINLIFGLPHHAARAARDDRQQMGPHHQHRLGPRARRLAPSSRPMSRPSTACSG